MNAPGPASIATVQAPAKLNLFFEVLARRDDGYHEIETLMVPISLCDTLVAWANPIGQVRLDCRWAAADSHDLTLGELPLQSENLALRAAELLRARAGVEQGIHLQLLKRVPAAAGLGGGSSDAAAALVAASAVWRLGWPHARLAELAAELGSDVPFFLDGGAAICRGRGERVAGVADLAEWHFVVVRPPEGLSTAEVYRHCRPAERPRSVGPLVEALRAGDGRRLKHLVFNRLQPAAESLSPWIEHVGRELAQADCLAHQMTGSGSGYFGICRHARHARRVAGRLRARRIGRVYTARASRRQPLL
jgi:4-diphosphocytidyl-2-C-methyl-D-erythritol kinase